ncbi:hypothetical protein [Cyclobacterium roseum]|uniref:hypothetical protein n=1 Tax=Cyclobacterium roseum TaxID=2666137 RepID=UPI001391B81F|nr:hypothetical protein [Cyclobacterium roseum]
MQHRTQFQVFVYNFSLAKDEVDKGSNRKTPGTAGSGPRPPKRNEYPDQENESEKKDKKTKEKH